MVYNPFILRSGISQSVPFSIIELGVVPKCFCKAACEVFGFIESCFVCYLRYIHIVRQPVTDNKFPRKIQPVVTHELSADCPVRFCIFLFIKLLPPLLR